MKCQSMVYRKDKSKLYCVIIGTECFNCIDMLDTIEDIRTDFGGIPYNKFIKTGRRNMKTNTTINQINQFIKGENK